MTRANAHRILAQEIGDPVLITGSPSVIPDGVRYSKALRDSYIYRSMIHFLHEAIALAAAKGQSRQARDQIMMSMYPTYQIADTLVTPTAQLQVQNLTKRVAYLYTPYIANPTFTRDYVLPQRTPAEFFNRANTKHTIKADPCCMIVTDPAGVISKIHTYINDDDLADMATSGMTVFIARYIPVPADPSTQGTDDEIQYDETMMDAVLKRAAWYARSDSFDINDIDAAIKVLEA